MKMKKLLSIALSLALSLGLLAGCGGGNSSQTDGSQTASGSLETAQPADGTVDTLLVGTSVEPSTLDPHIHSNVSTRFMLQNIYRGLVGYNLDGEIQCEVADSYEISDDNLTYTFTLKDNVTFHDGTPVTAEDVKYSFDRIMADDSTATYKSYFTAPAPPSM